MIKSIKIKPDTFESEILLFKEINKLKKINVLFGGNGVGKTTFLQGILKNNLILSKTKKVPKCNIVMYQNSINNARKNDPNPMMNSERYAKELISKVHAINISEGQSIVYSILNYLSEINIYLKENTEESLVVLLDEIDSGLSVDHINLIFSMIIDLSEMYDNLQFFISTNSYHFVYIVKNVLSMYTGEWIDIESYKEYFELLNSERTKLYNCREKGFLDNAPEINILKYQLNKQK